MSADVVARVDVRTNRSEMPFGIGPAGDRLCDVLGRHVLAAEPFELRPHGGLALANSLATALEMVGLLLLMRRRLNGLDGGSILAGAGPFADAVRPGIGLYGMAPGWAAAYARCHGMRDRVELVRPAAASAWRRRIAVLTKIPISGCKPFALRVWRRSTCAR